MLNIYMQYVVYIIFILIEMYTAETVLLRSRVEGSHCTCFCSNLAKTLSLTVEAMLETCRGRNQILHEYRNMLSIVWRSHVRTCSHLEMAWHDQRRGRKPFWISLRAVVTTATACFYLKRTPYEPLLQMSLGGKTACHVF